MTTEALTGWIKSIAHASQRDRDAITLEAIPALSLFAAGFYLVLTIGHIFLLPDDIRLTMIIASASTVCTTAFIFVLAKAQWLSLRHANPIMLLFSLLLLGNSILHFHLTQDPDQVANVALVLAFLGLFHLSIPYMAGSMGLVYVSWAVLIHPNLSSDHAAHYLFFLFGASILTLLAFGIRWRAHTNLILAKQQAIARELSLAEAVTRAKMAENMASEERSKNEFVANMSHELRTPLNAIIGFSDVLKDELFGSLGTDENREYIKEINEAGHRLLLLLNDVLDLSALSSDDIDIQCDWLDLEDVAGRCAALALAREASKPVEISIDLSPDTAQIFSDERRIKQILVHLLSNAVKFNDAGGWVRITSSTGPSSEVLIQISDSGQGMTAEELQSASDPFWQGDASLTRAEGGAGLGLALAGEMVRHLGGHMTLNSEPGAGTVATVWLPPEALPRGQSEPEQAASFSNAESYEWGRRGMARPARSADAQGPVSGARLVLSPAD